MGASFTAVYRSEIINACEVDASAEVSKLSIFRVILVVIIEVLFGETIC